MEKKNKRFSISKGLRFSVFARDGFSCKYCGKSTSQGVILHIDHVVPVSKGGTNEIYNLVTACQECNLGKSDRRIGVKEEGKSLAEEVERLKKIVSDQEEYMEQVKEYYKYQRKSIRIKSSPPEMKEVNRVLSEYLGYTVGLLAWKRMSKLYEEVGYDRLLEAVEIARKKNVQKDEERHRYLCGVLNNFVRKESDPYYDTGWKIRNYFLSHGSGRGSGYYVDHRMRPYVELFTLEFLKELVDETFEASRSSYFEHLMSLCKKWEETLSFTKEAV